MKLFSKLTMSKLCVFVALTFLLAGCGVRPGTLRSPNAPAPDVFPRTYPAESTL